MILLERDHQLTELRAAFAAAVAAKGRTVVVDGPAGAGKTSLLAAARDDAAAAGLRCLSARGAELEEAFAYGVLRQLLDPVLREPGDLFAGPARFAAPLLDLDVPGVSAPPDDFAARHALFWLIANLAADGPLAVLVDDGHWADTASLQALAHLANRLEDLPVALVVAARSEETGPGLEALRAVAGVPMAVPPLGTDAAAELVRSLEPAATDARVATILQTTGGNPFLLTELARSGTLDATPERVTREIGRRLERLPEEARALARAAAVLGDVPLRQAAALAGVGDSAAPADVLVAAGILRDVDPLRFLHPLIRTAVYAGIGPARQGEEHRRAARLLAEEGGAPEQVAAQLLRCPAAGDVWVYEQLTAAAGQVGARSAFEAQATYLRRALAESPPAGARVPTLLALAEAEAASSRFPDAVAHLREALRAELSPLEAHPPSLRLANLLAQTGYEQAAMDVLEADIERLADHPEERAVTETALIDVGVLTVATRERILPRLTELRRQADAGELRHPGLLGGVAMDMSLAGDSAELAVERAEPAVALYTGRGTSVADWAGLYAVMTVGRCGHFAEARAEFDRGLAVATERGAVLDRAANLFFRAELCLWTGDLDSAELDARTMLAIAEGYHWSLIGTYGVTILAQALLERSQLEDADDLLHGHEYGRGAADLAPGLVDGWVYLARARVHLAADQVDEAIADAREASRRLQGSGAANPMVSPWRSVLAEALVRGGQLDEARRLVEDELARARRFGARRAVGIALMASAIVRPERGLAVLQEAVAVLEGSGAPLELARAHVRLGGALRVAGRLAPAREQLRLGVDLAHRWGGRRVEDEGLDELRATGARPRRRATTGWDALTPSERRIAELAAAGRQNREIAEELFVTTSTVEFHLRNAYRKLGVGGRGDLVVAG